MSDAAPYVSSFVLEYAYKRSLGPVLSEFFTSLRDGVLKGARTADGRVLMPPTEYDPMSGAAIAGLEVVAETGSIVSWTWVAHPDPRHPVDEPFAFALVRLDGTDTDLLHVVLSGREAVTSGARVRLEWKPAAARVGSMTDIAGFRVISD